MVWEVYWSKAQLKMRQDQRMLATQTALNRLWHCRALPGSQGQLGLDVHRALTYCDRLRIRKPGDQSFTLGPHIDGGSTERWEDEAYRKVYAAILAGDWEEYDAFDGTHRAGARQELYGKSIGACSLFRSFQGWLSLSSVGQGRGALMVVPMVRESTAFIMMRPFLEDVPPDSFCGANPGKVQDLFPEFHQGLIDGLVPTPEIRPGDSFWWHCDLVHAVEGTHSGAEDASVLYIPSVPLCARNAEYIQMQAARFAGGLTPPDFPPNHAEVECASRGAPDDLDEAGLRSMGLAEWPEAPVAGETRAAFEATRELRGECRRIARQCHGQRQQ